LSVVRSLFVGVRYLVWFLPSREVVGFFYGVAGGRSPSKIAVRVRRWRSLSQPALERALACAGERRHDLGIWMSARTVPAC